MVEPFAEHAYICCFVAGSGSFKRRCAFFIGNGEISSLLNEQVYLRCAFMYSNLKDESGLARVSHIDTCARFQ
jgi:hypothetical protein